MAKKCNNCPHAYYCWEESWEKGIDYCYRDKEDLSVNKKDGEYKNECK